VCRCVQAKVAIVRVHDVKPMVQTIKMFEAVQKQEVSSHSS